MKASPFIDDSTAEETFTSKVSEILSGRGDILSALAPYQDPDSQLIGPFMREVRGKSTEDRREQYLKSRLLDQKTWYTKKASDNSLIESRWFYATTGLQFFAIVLAIIQFAFS